MPMLELALHDNLTKMIKCYHQLATPFPLDDLNTIPTSYLRSLFGFGKTEIEDKVRALEKLKSPNAASPKSLNWVNILDQFYYDYQINLSIVDTINDEEVLFRYLLHALLQRLTGQNSEQDHAVIEILKKFTYDLAKKTYDKGSISDSFLNNVEKIHNAILDLGYQNATLINQIFQRELEDLKTTNKLLSRQVSDLEDLRRIASDRGQNGTPPNGDPSLKSSYGQAGLFGSSTGAAKDLRLLQDDYSPAGRYNLGSGNILKQTIFSPETQTQVLAWLRHTYPGFKPQEPKGFQDHSIALGSMCNNLETVIRSLTTIYFDEYIKNADTKESKKVARDLEKAWTSVWNGTVPSSGDLKTMINRLLVTRKNDSLAGTPPVLDPEGVIKAVLKRGIQIINSLLLTMELPSEIDARSWCMFLYAYRSMLFALLRPLDPNFVNDDPNGKNVSQPMQSPSHHHSSQENLNSGHSNQLDETKSWPPKNWAYIEDLGQVRTMIHSMLSRYHTQELAHRSPQNVRLPLPARCLTMAIDSIKAAQNALTIDDAYRIIL